MRASRATWLATVMVVGLVVDSASAEADEGAVEDWRFQTSCADSNLIRGLAVQHLSKRKPHTAASVGKLHVSPTRTWKLGDTVTDALRSAADDGEAITAHAWVSIPFTATKGETITFQRRKGVAEAKVQICEYHRKKSAPSWADFAEDDLVAGDARGFSAGARLGNDKHTVVLSPDRGPRDRSNLSDSKIVVVAMLVPKSDVTVAFDLGMK